MPEMGLVEKIKKVMLSPSEFFDSIKSEQGVGAAFKYLAILSLVNLIVGLVGYSLSIPSLSPLGSLMTLLPLLGSLATLVGVGFIVATYVGGLIISFIGTGFIHVFARLLKGKGDYGATYRALTYASTPSLLLGWIPWVGIIIGLYSFYLELKGISKLHEVSMGRAFVILFVAPFVIALIIGSIIAAVAFVYIATLFSMVV